LLGLNLGGRKIYPASINRASNSRLIISLLVIGKELSAIEPKVLSEIKEPGMKFVFTLARIRKIGTNSSDEEVKKKGT